MKPLVYRKMTASQLAELYDDTLNIPDFYALLQNNRERAKVVRERLNPFADNAYGKEPLQKLDIYAPTMAKELPVLIDIHGGGWIAGSKLARSIPAESIMAENIIWVSIDYGLAPEYRMEEILSHTREAIAWIHKNITQYGGNPDKLFLSGQSAGAHLAATALIPGWHAAYGIPEDAIKGLIAVSGIYDLEGLVHAPRTAIQDILQLTVERARSNSPFHHTLKQVPSIIAYGKKEPLAYHLEATDFAQSLKDNHCPVSLFAIPEANHFDTINAFANSESSLFKAVIQMISKGFP